MEKKMPSYYLASLNSDRFFKKVFASERVAKAFLEDFLGVEIEKLERIDKTDVFLTDEAELVKFDYRCTFDGRQVIIEMQQWHKTDIVRRFYLYHAMNSSLQLEELPRSIVAQNKRTGGLIKARDYSQLKPSLTLIWLVDETLGYDMDYITFRLAPDDVMKFLLEDDLWSDENVERILQNRARVVELMLNDSKGLQFLPENALTFMFQRNVVKNPKIEKYSRWFRFAQRSKNDENKPEDFKDYQHDPVFEEMMFKLVAKHLTSVELKEYEEELEDERGFKKFVEKLKREHLAEVEKETRILVEREVQTEALRTKVEMVLEMFKNGMGNDMIVKIAGLPVETIGMVHEHWQKNPTITAEAMLSLLNL